MATQRGQINVAFSDADKVESVDSYAPRLAERGRVMAGMIVLAVLCLAAYAPALAGKFIFLDDITIVSNPLLRGRLQGLWEIWIHPTLMPHYQPLAYSLWLEEFKWFGTRLPGGYLAVNALLHTANALLLYTLLRKLELPGALLAAAIFAIHPINVEAVAWISQQPLLLCGVFHLSALLVYLRYCGMNPAPDEPTKLRLPRTPWLLYLIASALLAAALFSHAGAVTFPLVVLVLIWWERGRVGKSDVQALLPLLAMSVIWTTIILYADSRRAATTVAAIDVDSVTRILAAGRAVWTYLLHLLLPVNLSFAYPKWNTPWLGGIGLAAVIAVLALCWWARPRVGRGMLAACVLLLLGLLPGFFFVGDLDPYSFVADHQMYLAGIAVMAAASAALAPRVPARFGWAVGCAVVVLLGVATELRLPDYRNGTNLWSATLRRDPNSTIAHNNLGLIQLNQKDDTTAAMRHFKQALESDPDDPRTHVNIALVHLKAQRPDDAIPELLQALGRAPADAEARFQLGLAFSQKGQSAEAIDEYRRVLEIRPDYVLALNNIGLLHVQRAELEQAIDSFERAIEMSPGFLAPYLNLANLHFTHRRDDPAKYVEQVKRASDLIDRAMKVDPKNFELFMNGGSMAGIVSQEFPPAREDMLEKSEQGFKMAVRLRPDSALAHEQLGRVLVWRGKMEEAIYYLGKAVELEPDNSSARQELAQAKARTSS